MINTNSLVSIGIPVVKTQYLKKALVCCLEQTYKNIEIVVLNNARTHELREEIEGIVNLFDDNRIRYYRNDEQLPIIENWNKVFRLTKGELFSLLSDDDEYMPDFIQTLADLSIKYPVTNIFHCRVLINNEISNSISLSQICPEYEDGLDFIYHRIKGYRTQYLSDFMVRSSVFKDLDGFVCLPDGWGSDTISWFKMAQKGGVAYSSNVYFKYNNNTGSITNAGNLQRKINSITLYNNQVKEIIINIPKLNKEQKLKQKLIMDYMPTYCRNKYFRIVRQKSIFRLPLKIGEILFFVYMALNKKQKLKEYI